MKILWIEDFGGDLAPSAYVLGMFSNIIPKEKLDTEYNSDKDVWDQLPNLFEKYTLHQIYICKSYTEWQEIFEQQGGDFDVAIIDLNLISYKTPPDKIPENMERSVFDKKAGFYIYHQMIKNGFPDDDIAFFTGEENTLKEFLRYCGKMLIEKPKNIFEKRYADFERIRDWLDRKATNETLILRRGVIEGCRYLKEELRAINDSNIESRLIFYKSTSINIKQEAEAYKADVIDYLTKLESFFTNPRRSNVDHTLYFFVNALAAKWHMNAGYFKKSKATPVFKTKLEDLFHRTSQFQMKMLRNWCSHELLSPHITEKDAAFFFMLAMRSWIVFDLEEVLGYEKILSGLFPERLNKELNIQINSVLENYLEQSYFELKAFVSDIQRYLKDTPLAGHLSDNYFFSNIKGISEVAKKLEGNTAEQLTRRVRNISVRLVYQGYWHGLFPLWIKSTYYADMQTIDFNIEPIPPDSFLYFLGNLIFEESFREQQLSVAAG